MDFTDKGNGRNITGWLGGEQSVNVNISHKDILITLQNYFRDIGFILTAKWLKRASPHLGSKISVTQKNADNSKIKDCRIFIKLEIR